MSVTKATTSHRISVGMTEVMGNHATVAENKLSYSLGFEPSVMVHPRCSVMRARFYWTASDSGAASALSTILSLPQTQNS
jgi:hypothetical protein